MASAKERDKWERWFNDVSQRVERQKDSINRLVALLTECVAALAEIEAMPDAETIGDLDPIEAAVARAQQALAAVREPAAATSQSASELASSEMPEDPRRKY